jgi:hypothetical protein
MLSLDIENWDSFTIITWSWKTLMVSALVWLASGYLTTRLPSPSGLDPSLQQDPQQKDRTDLEPFQRQEGEHTYVLQPKADYKIQGLVVSTHDSKNWMDLAHAASGDYFNTHDLCVIWGENAASPALSQVKFTHGDWTCYFETKSMDAYKAFRKDQISNNHILPASKEVLKVINAARVGDQIEMTGQLVDYSMDGLGSRKTSMNRQDVENGACEIIYVTDAKFLARPPFIWRALRWLSAFSSIASLLVLIFAAGILPFLRPRFET